MSTENRANCVLGNGECPQTCPIYEDSKAISEELGVAFDPFQSRLTIVFGDAFNDDVNITHIAAVLASCVKEGKPQREITEASPNPSTPPTPNTSL